MIGCLNQLTNVLKLSKKFPGDYSGGATPDPIPNSEVKPSSADGTARETVWESRSSPGLNMEASDESQGLFFMVVFLKCP